MGTYGEIHKHFLQSMMSRAIVSKNTACELLAQTSMLLGYDIEGGRVSDEELVETLDEINRRISGFGMELKKVRSEFKPEEFIVLINVIDNSSILDKIDHIYSVKEREVFRLLLEGIVMNENYGTLTSIEALNLIPHMRPGETEAVLDKLVSDQWFTQLETGQIFPAPRCIAEFDLYFKANFHEHVQQCICTNVVFFGVLCPHCDAISHRHCFFQYNKRKDGQGKRCPVCKADVVEHYEGEYTQEDVEEAPQRKKSGGSKRARKGRTPETPQKTSGSSQEAGPSRRDDLTPEDEVMPGPSSGRRKRRSAE